LKAGQFGIPEMLSSDDINYAVGNKIPVYLVAPSGLGSVANPNNGAITRTDVF